MRLKISLVLQLLAPGFALGISACGSADEVCIGNQAPIPQPMQAGPQAFEKMPVYFVENQGQIDSSVAYYVHGLDKTLYFTPQGISLVMNGPGTAPPDRIAAMASPSFAIALDFVGSSPDVVPEGRDVTPTLVNYFKGPQERWRSALKTYSTLVYADLWPGIDLVYSGLAEQLKYTFVIHPGADPSQIKLGYRGGASIDVRRNGRLVVSTPAGVFEDGKPYTYQTVGDRRVEIESAYTLDRNADPRMQLYGFHVGAYDRREPLLLDPSVLVYSSLLGGNGLAYGQGIAVDGDGNAYVTGLTTATDFPITPGALSPVNHGSFDAFVAKMNADGTNLVYATYLGGAGLDLATRIAVDGEGNAYLVGRTESLDFPKTPGALSTSLSGTSDAFLVKLDPTGGSLGYATYLGGSGVENAFGIALDNERNAYVTGDTASTDFPTTAGAPVALFGGGVDAFVAKANASATALSYATYLGGAGTDHGFGIAVDASGTAYVTGDTTSADFPVTPSALSGALHGTADAFVASLNAAGTELRYSTYLGGAGIEDSISIAVDGDDNAYVVGSTRSSDFPATAGLPSVLSGYEDAFIAKVDPSGHSLVYAGTLGGSDGDKGFGIAVDDRGNAYVTGATSSTNFPVKGRLGSLLTGTRDAFLAKVRADGGGFDEMGYFGTPGYDEGIGIALDASGHVYVTGTSFADNVPSPPPPTPHSFFDAFVGKFDLNPPPEGPVPCGDPAAADL